MSKQAEFNASHTPQQRAAMLLMSFGCDDSDIEAAKLADPSVIEKWFIALMLSDETTKFLEYLRK